VRPATADRRELSMAVSQTRAIRRLVRKATRRNWAAI